MTLFEIDEKFKIALEYGCNEDGEILSDDELKKLLDELELNKETKIDNIISYIKSLDAESEAIKSEKQKLNNRQKQKENKSDSLKRYLSNYMKFNNIPKFESAKNVASFRKSTSVNITDLSAIPPAYIKEREIKEDDVKKSEIRNFITNGGTINGAELVQNNNLNIK